MERNTGINKVKEIYQKLSYYDVYSSSIMMFIIITLVTILVCAYSMVASTFAPIKNDWVNQRCKPSVIPFAGLINKPNDMTVSEFTAKNFENCSQTILSGITGEAVKPLTFITSSLSDLSSAMSKQVNSIREMIDYVRSALQHMMEEVMGRVLNITIPLRQIILGVSDMLGKIQGALAGALFTVLGSYYILKNLLSSIAEMILRILMIIAAAIMILWAMPFTIPIAIALTIPFAIIAAAFATILILMKVFLNIQVSGGLPKLHK